MYEAPGIDRPVEILRDGHGIPCIRAETDADAWYGLGFCQGQDRAFQLELIARVVRGTLAEIAGPRGVPIDRLSRRIGFYRSAEAQIALLGDEIRTMVDAFARGATAGMRLGGGRVAHEYTLLRAKPTEYTAADVGAYAKLQAFATGSNWDAELARLKILTEDGPEALAALDPTYPEWHLVTTPHGVESGPATDRLAQDIEAWLATVGAGGGSNNWAVAPSRTSSGRPIVANDPHLPSTLPTQWYLAHVRTPDWAVAGASLVGTPVFPVGHNDVAAWGVTAGFGDNTDLFMESVGPDGRSVRQGDGFVRCEVRREVIHVKGGEPVTEDVLITPRGPIIGPALAGVPDAVSIRSIWLDPRPVNGFLKGHRCRNFEEFRRCFEHWPLGALNLVYADTSGKVAWQYAGDTPIRKKGWGTLPMAGWVDHDNWDGATVPFDEMPYLADPDGGFVATANNAPTRDGEGPFLGVDWMDGYRVTRITEALESRQDWDVAGALALQMDEVSLPWREVREAVVGVPTDGSVTSLAVEELMAWDGIVSADSTAATIFELFLADMMMRVARARASKSAEWALGRGFGAVSAHTVLGFRRVGHLVSLLREQPEGWFDRPWPLEIADALSNAVAKLNATHGEETRLWAWGRVRPLTFRHRVGDRRFLRSVFNRGPVPWGGDTNTVAQSATDPLDPSAHPLVVASVRAVMDVGEWDKCRFSLPGGQSGNPVSPHYDDLLDWWLRGEGVPIAWSDDEVERTAEATLHLTPQSTAA